MKIESGRNTISSIFARAGLRLFSLILGTTASGAENSGFTQHLVYTRLLTSFLFFISILQSDEETL